MDTIAAERHLLLTIDGGLLGETLRRRFNIIDKLSKSFGDLSLGVIVL